MVTVKKIIAVLCVVLVVVFCFLKFSSGQKALDEGALKDMILSAARQRAQTDFAPDILFDNFPASAWLFAKKYGYDTDPDVVLGYDRVLETAEETAEGPGKGNLKVSAQGKVYELPMPDRVMSQVHYSFYSMCPLEVTLFYDGRGKEISEWAKEFKDIAIVAGSPDGRELYGAGENSRIVYAIDGNKVSNIKITFYSKNREKINSLKASVAEALRKSLKPVYAGEWVFRSQWSVPNGWIEKRSDLEEFTRLQLKDFSYSVSVPLLKGEIVLWNGYFIEGVLYFTYDSWKKASPVLSKFNIPEIELSETRDGDIVEVKISDRLLKQVFLYLQGLMNSNSYDKLRKTTLEMMD